MVKLTQQVTKNDTLDWDLTLNALLAPGTVLKYYFASTFEPITSFSIDPSEISNSNFKFSHKFDVVPGLYLWQLKTIGLVTSTIGQGQVEILPDLLNATNPVDLRSSASKMLAIAEEAISTLVAGGSVKEYEIAGRRLNRYSLEELLALRNQLQKEVASAKRAQKLAKGLDRKVYTRFVQPY